MGRYKDKLIRISVRLQSNPSRLVMWYFDLNDEAAKALDLCANHSGVFDYSNCQLQGDPPDGDVISDFSEFENWVLENTL